MSTENTYKLLEYLESASQMSDAVCPYKDTPCDIEQCPMHDISSGHCVFTHIHGAMKILHNTLKEKV